MFVTTFTMEPMYFWEMCLLQCVSWALPGEEEGGGKTRDVAVNGKWGR